MLSKDADNIAAKLSEEFEGPYRISKRITPVVLNLSTDSGEFIGKKHIRHLKFVLANRSERH